MSILLTFCLVLLIPLIALIFMYLLASVIVFILFQVPLSRKHILNRLDENLNQIYDEFIKKRYTCNDCNRQSNKAKYIKQVIKCYLDFTWRGVKNLIPPQWHIGNHHLNQ